MTIMDDEVSRPRRSLSWLPKVIVLLAAGVVVGVAVSRMPQLQLKGLTQPSPKPQLQTTREVVKEQSAVIDVVKQTSPSVVAISGISQSRPSIRFFGPFQFQDPNAGDNREQSIGTGFVLTKDGLIVTNKHVVSSSDVKYVVVANEDKKYDVKNIYRDPENDLAIIKIDANNLTPLELGDSSQLQAGQFVIAIGNALGEFRNTVTTGVVSGLGRAIVAGDFFGGFQERLDNLIQTDAAINPGNSGGPLLDIGGKVIGVNVATSASAQNIGFAIPINTVKDSVNRFNSGGKFSRPFLGVSHQQIDRRTAILNNVPEGAYVRDVVPNSPADKAGIKVDDIITKINGQPVNETNGGLAAMIAKFKVGDTVTLTYYRGTNEQETKATLQEASNQ